MKLFVFFSFFGKARLPPGSEGVLFCIPARFQTAGNTFSGAVIMQIRFLDKVRGQNPLVHNITNGVAMNFTANGLLALGASPIMADEVSEMADMAAICSALLINIGTLRRQTVEAMLAAGKAANARGIPVVFDPVGAAATQFRRDTVERLLAEVRLRRKWLILRAARGRVKGSTRAAVRQMRRKSRQRRRSVTAAWRR